jgi:hypothetical protein
MLTLDLLVDEDFVCFIGAPKIPRPLYISRARWLAYWEFFMMQGVTVRSLATADKFMKGKHSDKAFDY